MLQASLVGIGFSVVAAPLLFLAYVLYYKSLNQSLVARVACFALLAGLLGLQYGHYLYFAHDVDVLDLKAYRLTVFLVPPFFYFFSQAILFPEHKKSYLQFFHFLPITLLAIEQTRLIIVFSFVIGFAYCAWLSSILYRLRHIRARFKEEFFFFSLFTVFAFIVLCLGVLASVAEPLLYYYFYSNSISFSLILIVFTLLVKPELLESIDEVVQQGYVQTTLNNIDKTAICKRIEALMKDDKLYQNENLSLSTMANVLDLSGHQLSELINSVYGLNFSRFIRKHRIQAAKDLMLANKQASILSISMEVGFKSQSNFYAAFKEEEGQSPGEFRKA